MTIEQHGHIIEVNLFDCPSSPLLELVKTKAGYHVETTAVDVVAFTPDQAVQAGAALRALGGVARYLKNGTLSWDDAAERLGEILRL